MGSTIHAFAMTLAVFLVGLAAGSLAISWWLRRSPPTWAVRHALGAAVCLLGCATVLAPAGLLVWFELDPAVQAMQQVTIHVEYPHLGPGAGIRLVLLTVFPVTLCSGAVMPLAVHLARRSGRVGWAGKAYGLNSLGCIVGVLCAQFLLLELLQVRDSLRLTGILGLALGGYLLLRGPARGRLRRGALAAIALVVFFAALLLAPVRPMELFITRYLGARMHYYHEDPLASVTVASGSPHAEASARTDTPSSHMWPPGSSRHPRSLFINGHEIAGGPGEGHFARATLECVRGTPSRAAIIGLGTGGTCMAAVDWGSTPVQVDCVEILAAVIEAQPLFPVIRDHSRPLRRPNMVQQDGRHFLLTTDRMYDALFVDGGQVEFFGGYELFTREFYELAARRLRPGGVLGIWVQMQWQRSHGDDLMRTLLKTKNKRFQRSFRHVDLAVFGADTHTKSRARSVSTV